MRFLLFEIGKWRSLGFEAYLRAFVTNAGIKVHQHVQWPGNVDYGEPRQPRWQFCMGQADKRVVPLCVVKAHQFHKVDQFHGTWGWNHWKGLGRISAHPHENWVRHHPLWGVCARGRNTVKQEPRISDRPSYFQTALRILELVELIED